IGDVQGCYTELEKLLQLIHFDQVNDTLWFTGDLVNRGPKSLDVLRLIKSLGDKHITVLGNHDLHLLAVYYGYRRNEKDTFLDVLQAADKEDLIAWLHTRPIFHYDPQLNYALVHAGLAAAWTIDDALNFNQEVTRVLQSNAAT